MDASLTLAEEGAGDGTGHPAAVLLDDNVHHDVLDELEHDRQEETVYNGPFDFEIVGLYKGTNGRECCQHSYCGLHLRAGEVVRLVHTVVDVHGEAEEAVKLVRIMEGVDGCTVGFIPRVQANLPKITNAINQFAIVKEIYNESESAFKQTKSKRNSGMACCLLMSSIVQSE
jgi:hypothetical protein